MHLYDSQALVIRGSVRKALGIKGKGHGPASCSLKIPLERWLSPALYPEVAFAPTECGDLQWAELLSFCSLCKDLESATGQSIAGGRGKCLKVKAVGAASVAEVTLEKCEKTDTWADDRGQLLTFASRVLGCYLVFFHCPSHHFPPSWALCFGL